MKVIVIGGGPAGLVTMKFLATAHDFYHQLTPIDVQLFEAEDDIGGTFKYRVWDQSELVSSKFLTPFSDFRIGKDAPDFLSTEAYVKYLWDYAEHFDLFGRIHCSKVVSSVRRRVSGPGHVVTVFCRKTGRSEEHEADAVAVCSGLNLTPNIPDDIAGLIAANNGMSQAAPNSDWATSAGREGAQLRDDESWMNRALSAGSPPFPEHSFRLLHSSTFKNLPGQDSELLSTTGEPSTVVVLGAGETAHDLAAIAVNHPGVGRVLMCHRDGFFVAPKVVPEPVILGLFGRPHPGKRPNKPIDMTVASLFDTAYVPPVLQRSNLLWDAYNVWIKGMFATISGTSSGLDQWAGGVSSGRRHIDSYFVVKTTKAMPYISAPYRSQAGIWNSIRSAFINIPLPDTDGREIELAPWPKRVGKDAAGRETLEFPDNGSPESTRLKLKTVKAGPVMPDTVIIATGYRREFLFLSDEYPKLPDCKVRGIYKDLDDGLAYIGFVRPSIGAIPPLAELQAQLWVSRLVERHLSRKSSSDEETSAPVKPLQFKRSRDAVEPYELDYALHPRGGYDFFAQKLGVDHEGLAYQLALDMGSAPRASHVLRKHGSKVFFTWAMGPNFNTKFRLVGPWAAPEQAAEIMRTELFDVVKRTGGVVFFVTYTVLPQLIFGFMSMFLMFGHWLARAVGGVFVVAASSAHNLAS